MNLKIILQSFFALSLFVVGGGCAISDNFAVDLVHRVWGADGGADKTMVVYLHGAVSRGGPADYMYRHAKQTAFDNPGVIGVAIVRPGYYDSDGLKSPGDNHNRRDNCTARNITAIAKAIIRLRSQYRAEKVIAVGHSAGAMCLAAIIGPFNKLFHSAILVSCPCNLDQWTSARGKRPFNRSKSPHLVVEEISGDIIVRAITGELDSNTFPALARDYVAALKQKGVDAEVQIVANAGHRYRELAEQVRKQVSELL